MNTNQKGRVSHCQFLHYLPFYKILFVVVFAFFSAGTYAQQTLQVIELRENLHLIAGAGSHIVVQHGDDGVVVVDSGSGERNEEVLATIDSITGSGKIRYIINTSGHPRHVGGNEAFSAAGEPFASRSSGSASRNVRINSEFSPGAIILGHENVLFQMLNQGFPPQSWPQESYATPTASMRLNGEGIEIRHVEDAHSNADSVIEFKRSEVFVIGELVNFDRFPEIDIANGGDVNGLLVVLTDLIWKVIPQLPLSWREGGTYIIPASGRIMQRNDLVQYRDMVAIIRDRVAHLMEQGMSLEEIQLANPAHGFVGLYGDDSPDSDWTTAMFIESVYTSLNSDMSM